MLGANSQETTPASREVSDAFSKYVGYAAVLGILVLSMSLIANAQVRVGIGVGPVGIGIGPAPVCAYGYYPVCSVRVRTLRVLGS